MRARLAAAVAVVVVAVVGACSWTIKKENKNQSQYVLILNKRCRTIP